MSSSTPVLTRRQEAVYEYLLQRHRAGHSPPTLDELCEGLGVRSRESMSKHLQALAEAGLLEPVLGARPGVRLKAPEWREPVQLPLLGFVSAARPSDALGLGDDRGAAKPLNPGDRRAVLG